MIPVQKITFNHKTLISVLRKANLVLENTAKFMQISHNQAKKCIDLFFVDQSTTLQEHVQYIDQQPVQGEIFVEYTLIYNLLKTLYDNEQVCFEVYSTYIEVKYKSGMKKISLSIQESYIYHNITDIIAHYTMSTISFIESLKFVKHTLANDDIRLHYKGVSVDIRDNKRILWSSDGYRFAISQNIVDSHQNIRAILPKKIVDSICNIDIKSTTIEIMLSESVLQMHFDNTIITSLLINAEPFDYSPIMTFINQKADAHIICNAERLSQAIERALIGCDEKKRIKIEKKTKKRIAVFD